jgi:hypothetical protein
MRTTARIRTGAKEQKSMKSAIVLALTSITLTLAACNSAEQGRTASAPPGDETAAVLTTPKFSSIVPPAPAERGPMQENANTSVPDAALAFSTAKAATPLPPSKGGALNSQALNVRAQEAAAKAPDTASADAAKNDVLASGHG